MPPKDISKEQIAQAIQLLKNVINDKHSARVGYALDVIFGTPSLTDHSSHIIEKVSSAIIENGEYIKVRKDGMHDYYISKNPSYRLEESVIKANQSTEKLNNDTLPKMHIDQKNQMWWSIGLAGISLIFIAITAIQQFNDPLPQKLERLETAIQETSKRLESIETSLQEVNSSIQKIMTDTFVVKSRN